MPRKKKDPAKKSLPKPRFVNKAAKNKKADRSDFKPTRCSNCRFTGDCSQQAKLIHNLEYVDCIPALLHYSDRQLEAASALLKKGGAYES